MRSSRKITEKRSVFDVHASRGSKLKNIWSKISGAKTLNLRPKFRVRHPWITAGVVAAAMVFVVLGARRFFVRAEVADFYPSSCLGTWQNSANAEGSPENLSLEFASSTFNASNSAIFAVSSTQIYCGGFLPPDFKPTGNITRVGITFLWNVAGGSTGLSGASAAAASSPETPSSTAPTSTLQSASTSTPNTNSSSTTTSFLFNFWQPISTAFAEQDTSTPSTDTTTTATITASNATTIAPPPATTVTATTTATTTVITEATTTTTVATTSTTSTAAGDAGSSTPIILGPPISADLSPLATTTASTTTTTTESVAASSTLPAPPLPPDQNFLEVSYSTDGTNWISLAKIDPTNWQNFTISLPIANWDDIKKLQIRIGGIPTSLTELPSVLLDGMFVETQYEIPPVAIGPVGSGSPSPQPAQNVAVPASAVIVLPPQNAPLPAGGDTNFKADEAPSFDLDLGNLPAPISTTTTTTAPAPPAPPPVSAPTSNPTGLLHNASHALASTLGFFLRTLPWGDSASAQTTDAPGAELPTSDNPVVAKILDPKNHETGLQPTFVFLGSTLRVLLPQPGREFKPGAYSLKLWVWRNGAVYHSENTFSWGVLAVNFNKSIFTLGDKAKIGFGVLDDGGHTICNANIDMDVASPLGKVSHFETQNWTIARSSSCGSATVTNNPDYTASLIVSEPGTYTVSVAAKTANGVRQISDKFEAQNPPLFDVERFGPTRIYPPATYNVSITVKANADFSGNITETAPASFNITTSAAVGQKTSAGDAQTISWPVNLKKGDSVTLSYFFKAPDVSPELYKLGALTIGNWQEARQWQIAADAISNTVIFITSTSTASTTWTVPTDWNNASNTIEVIGGGGGGGKGSGTSNSGGGGGGGAYAKISNFSTSTGNIINIDVGTGGAGAGTAGATGTITFFNWNGSGSSSTCSGTTMSVCATGGSPGVNGGAGGLGGASSTSVGTTRFAGGRGGTQGGSNASGGGGGGAAGLNGNGNYTTAQTTTTGGSADAGSGGGGGAAGNPGATGGAGTEWDSTHGSGGGAGGANASAGTGGRGGNYGGGGGGGGRSNGVGGAGMSGIIVITYTPITITLGDGTQPAPVTIGPGANATTSGVFNFQTNAGTSSISNVSLTISTTTGVSQVQIMDGANTVVYGSSTNPGSTSLNVTTTGMNVSTTLTTFDIMIKPLSATAMPAPPGGNYVVTSTVTGWTDSKSLNKAGANTTSSVITIDNSSPADVANASGTASSTQVTLSWTNPGDPAHTTTTVLRATSSITVAPTEGTFYSVGNTIGSTTVACVVASSTAGCTDSGLTNGTPYYYQIFTTDKYANYSVGTTTINGPFTPSAAAPTVSNIIVNNATSIVLSPNTTKNVDVGATVSDTGGCSAITGGTTTVLLYRSGIGSSTCMTSPNNANCYIASAFTASSSCVSNAVNTTTTFGVYYFAQATDASSSFPSQNWKATVIFKDSVNVTTSADAAAGQALLTLTAVNITTSSINYGTIIPSSTTQGTNQTTTIQNAGNSSTTLQISGTALVLGANPPIATSSQHYATSSFAYGGAEQQLNGSPTTVPGFTLTAPTTTTAVQNDIFWGLGVSAGTPTGTYNGTTTFTAVFSP